jgi:hypothetical protein
VKAAERRDLQRAIDLYEQVIALDPGRAEPYYKRANALKDLEQLDAAIASYTQAIDRQSDYSFAYCNRGVVQHTQGKLQQALASLDGAIALAPTDAFSHYNRALVLRDLARWDEALASYDRALASDPNFSDAAYNRALALLHAGDFVRGWRAFESRWQHAQRLRIGEDRHFEQPRWLGQVPLAGTRLLLHSEQGLGDTIQFCRYATLASRAGAAVILEAQPALLELLETLQGVATLVSKGAALPQFDYHCPLMSLPLGFNTTLASVPAPNRYLGSNPARVAQWQAKLGVRRRPRIGLVWSGNPNNSSDRQRSISLADWLPHLPPGLDYFCLQTQVRDADRQVLDATDRIFSFAEEALDFAGTAALCDCLDLVISVDTSLAHLGGALGRRTWTLLAANADWRWLRDRLDTPWYPSMKLYRQRNAADWNEVLARVAGDLQR